MEWISDPAIWASLLTLTMLEIVLGIDNVIFVSIVANKLPEAQRGKARGIGLSMALILRLVFLSMLAWLIGLTNPLFTIFNQGVSWRDLILLSGGLFLIYKGFRLRNQYRTDFFCTKFMGQFFTHNSSNPFNRHR